MGSGIALAALLADRRVTLYDVDPAMLERAREYIETYLNRKQRAINIKYLRLTSDLKDLQGSSVIIEAVPEKLALKQELFKQISAICPPPVILATNTSTLPVTAIASAADSPERVAGMHFFNPAPVLPLVEVVQGAQTHPDTVQTLVLLAEIMGKSPVVARDTPGFIVNRVARPFYGEALRLVSEGIASHEQVDRVVQFGGGFRMGPFRLMDLIGIDINFAATQSMFEQTFEEPRYRPSLIQAQMVQQKALGRKTGHGFYAYSPEALKEEEPIELPIQTPNPGQLILLRNGTWSPGLVDLFHQAGYELEHQEVPRRAPVAGMITTGSDEWLEGLVTVVDQVLPPDVPLFCQCADITLTEIATWVEHPERLVGFDGLFFANGPVATLVASPILNHQIQTKVEQIITSLGREPIWIQDSPGLILPRIVCMLSNEAAFAAGEGVATIETIDKAMQLGTNYPKGPLAWAKEIGYSCVVSVLDHLYKEYGEERYRVAPMLRRWARLSQVSA